MNWTALLRGTFIVALCLLVALVTVLVMDAIGRLFLKDKTEYEIVDSESSIPDRRYLFVYYPGILADGRSSSSELIGTWDDYGSAMLVSYKGERFIAGNTVETVVSGINFHADEYDEVVFIGSSMGGLLSYDTASALLDEGTSLDMSFVLVDAPTKRADLQSPLDKLSLLATFTGGPITNLFSRPYFDATFVAPKEDNIEPNVNRDQLARKVDEAKSFPLSTNNDWVRYILGHGEMEQDRFKGFKAVYVRSTRDHDTVRPEAFDSWQQVFGDELKYVEVDSTHVGYNERPETWRQAFPAIFNEIGVS